VFPFLFDERTERSGSLMKSSSRSLFSPSTTFGQIRLTRRSVQSQAEFRLFPLDESSCPSAVNNRFCNYRVRDKVCSSTRWAMKKAVLLSILVVVVQLAVDVKAQAQQPTKVPRIGFLCTVPLAAYSARIGAFRQVCVTLGTWRERTLSSSTVLQKGNPIC
jgi:hypothetical protein